MEAKSTTDTDIPVAPGESDTDAELADLRAQRETLDKALTAIRTTLQDAGVPPNEKQTARQNLGELQRELRRVEEETEEHTRWHPISERDLTTEPPKLDWIWDSYIPAGKNTILAAGGGTGKTSLESGLVLHRAMGIPFFLGAALRPGTTVIVTAEDDLQDYLRKFHAWKHHLTAFDPAQVAKKVIVYDRSGLPCELAQNEKGQHKVAEFAHKLAATINKRAPEADLIILETASRFGAGDESNGAMSALNRACEVISNMTKAAILLSVHVSKAASRDRVADAYVSRGGSALSDNARSGIVLSKLDAKAAKTYFGGSPDEDLLNRVVQLTLAKNNFSRGKDPLLLERVSTSYDGGLVLRPLKNKQAEELRRAVDAQKTNNGELIANVVAHLSKTTNAPVTLNKLRENLDIVHDLTKLSRSQLPEALANAVRMGSLQRDEKGRYTYVDRSAGMPKPGAGNGWEDKF